MKTLFPFAFNKHLYALMCTLFLFLNVSFNAYTQSVVTVQCQNGLTMSLRSDLTTSGTAIPFGTPIRITTTVTNTGTTAQTVDLRLFLSPDFPALHFDVLCADDYFWNGTIGQRNNLTIGVGEQIVSSMRVVYNVVSTDPLSNGRNVKARLIFPNSSTCTTPNLAIRPRNIGAQVIGVPGQTTTVNSLPPSNTGSLIVRGNVILDVNHLLEPVGNGLGAIFPYIYMDEGATLIIPNGRTLTLKGTLVFGIRSMWNSIIVEPGGSLITGLGSDGLNTITRKTSIKDGIRAIEARGGSNINMSYTDFEDNERGFYVPPTTGALQNISFTTAFQACDFNGTGQLRPMPTATPNCNTDKIDGYPFAGMDINDLGSLITINGAVFNTPRPRFRNMSNGILAKRTRLFVNRAKFENIKSTYSGFDGLGIYSHDPNSLLLVAGASNPSDLDFSNCTQGIIYENFGTNDLAQINSLHIDNTADAVGIGIKAVNNNFNQSFIYANNIKAKTGIISGWNRFNTTNVGEIYNNVIEPTSPSSPSSSLGIVGYDNSITGNWNIYSNIIDVQNAQFGMLFYSGTGARVTNNTIVLESASHVNASGIQASGSSNFQVGCNDISGSGIANSTYRSGIYISSGTGSSYTCNNTGATEVGFNIVGQCTPFSMSANRFNNHKVGLVVNNASVIGVQSYRGNKWQGPFINWGAEHNDQNIGNVLQSQFTVASNTPILPTFNASSPAWFQVISGTDVTCTSLNACPNGNPAGRIASSGSTDESFYASAISEQRMQTPYAEEMKWTAQRNAYGRLMDNPSHQNNRDKTNFIGRMRNASTGQLYQVEKGLKDIQNIGQEHDNVLMTNANTIKTLANEISDLDSKIFVAKDAEKTALMAQKKEKNATIYRLSTENAPRHAIIERKRNQEIQQLMRENERISARLQPEINEKEVNAIYLATVAQGKMALNSEQKATVRLIAYQCPSLGGNAVFAARSLYSLVENVNFNDLELCNVHSEPIQGLIAKRVETNYKISPNPATDMLIVSQSTGKAEAGEWMIFDTAGKLLLTKKVSENEVACDINIQKLSEGIYFVSFSVNGQKRFTQKLVKTNSN